MKRHLQLCIGVMGAGLGTSLQILVLVVQNTFPVSMAGVATATNNSLRQVGAPVAAAVVAASSPRDWPDCRPDGPRPASPATHAF